MPNFELPKMEIPAEFRDFADNSASQVREIFERMRSVAEAATDVIEETFATSTKGASDYGLKVIDATRVNTSAAFDFYAKLMTISDVVELATAHGRKQFRGCQCTIQGTRGTYAKGHDRDLEADDGKLGQDIHEGGLNFIAHKASTLSAMPQYVRGDVRRLRHYAR